MWVAICGCCCACTVSWSWVRTCDGLVVVGNIVVVMCVGNAVVGCTGSGSAVFMRVWLCVALFAIQATISAWRVVPLSEMASSPARG